MMIIDEKFELGQIVFLKTDPEQHPRIVTGITIRPGNTLRYYVSWSASEELTYYDIELSGTKSYTEISPDNP